MRTFIYSILLFSLMGCAAYQRPPFDGGNDWVLAGNVVSSHKYDMAVDFGLGNTLWLVNAGDGSTDLRFVSDEDSYSGYDKTCKKYLEDVLSKIPLKTDALQWVLADSYAMLRTDSGQAWQPDLIRKADGSVWVAEAFPVPAVQPADELWRNFILDKKKGRIVVVDRMLRDCIPLALVYMLQSERKGVSRAGLFSYDILSGRNIQVVGGYLESLMDISSDACNSHAPHEYSQCIMQADACFAQGDYAGAVKAFAEAFGQEDKIQGYHLYNAACAAALDGQTDVAFEYLQRRLARDADWYVDDPEADSDLASLHGDARWAAYSDTIKARRDRIQANFDMPLRRQLQDISRSDQEIRYQFLMAYNSQPRDTVLTDSLIHAMQRADSVNQQAICQILDTRGFVGSDVVGDACGTFWLVIQHAPLQLQQRYFGLFSEAAEKGDLGKDLVAMMDDRIAMFEDRPQRYGSQIVTDASGRRILYPLLDESHVDEWRREAGLPPLEEYLLQMDAERK